MAKSFLHINHKVWAGFLLVAVFILEIRRGYFKGFKNYLRSLSWKPYGLIFSITVLALIPVLPFDSVISKGIQGVSPPLSDWITSFGSYVGKGQNLWIMLGLFYMAVFILRLDRLRELAFSTLLASFLTSLMSLGFKFTALRARPNTELGPFSFLNWKGMIEDDRLFQSFPSGDVAVIAGAAAYLFCAFKKQPWRWLFLIFPLCTAFARIYLNRHWPSDALFATGLGFIGANFVWNYQKTKLPL